MNNSHIKNGPPLIALALLALAFTTGKPIWVGAGTLAENLKQVEAHPKLGIHYMIDRDGTVRASVPEEKMVHHILPYSGRSIAIKLINDGDGVDPGAAFPFASVVNRVFQPQQDSLAASPALPSHTH